MTAIDHETVRTGDKVKVKGGIGWLDVTSILDEGVGGFDSGQKTRWVRWPNITKRKKAAT